MSFWEAVRRMYLPDQASNFAAPVDLAFNLIYAVSIFFFLLIVGLTVYFFVRYARQKDDPVPPHLTHHTPLEIAWTIIPTIIVFLFFYWGARDYMAMNVAPADAEEIRITGKQWLWQFTYNNGLNTVNELRVPLNKAVRMLMSSEDVLHSFYVPEFRVKMDIIPGRYSSLWFEPTKLGEYYLFCAEYCGDAHSGMVGKVVVMEQAEYVKWLDEAGAQVDLPPVELGRKMYESRGCIPCHSLDGSVRTGPSLKGIFGKTERLANGQTVVVDENYIRESLLDPNAKVLEGYQPMMPTFKGLLNERQIEGVIEFIKEQK